jgi:hypothetical protein
MANEKRLIDVNKVIDSMQKCLDESPDKKDSVAYFAFESIITALKQEPTVDAVEVVHGYWEKAHDDLDIDRGWKCIHCNGSVYEMTYEPYQYCPHCGTKMDGDGNA